MSKIPFRTQKSVYYITRAFGFHIPISIFRKLREKHINYLPPDDPRVLERVNYYNKLEGIVPLNDKVSDLRKIRKERRTTYFFDFYEFARYFDPGCKFYYEFGDITEVPHQPAFVKSRPIEGDNANAVLLKLNKIRHFNAVKDPYSLEQKKDALVWRGQAKRGPRKQFLEKFAGKPNFDVGRIHFRDEQPEIWRPFLSVEEQIKYKFILSIEGIDVASNLKWIMASNSVCVMKKPRFETWFMEGKLIPGAHYIQVKDDFSDVEERMEYYLGHPHEMREIAENARQFTRQFLDPALERQISLLVIQKYFERTATEHKVARFAAAE